MEPLLGAMVRQKWSNVIKSDPSYIYICLFLLADTIWAKGINYMRIFYVM